MISRYNNSDAIKEVDVHILHLKNTCQNVSSNNIRRISSSCCCFYDRTRAVQEKNVYGNHQPRAHRDLLYSHRSLSVVHKVEGKMGPTAQQANVVQTEQELKKAQETQGARRNVGREAIS